MSTEPPAATTTHLRFAHIIIALSMLVMGACGMIYEYTLGVLGNHLMGSSHQQIFVVIGLMMFSMGLGSLWQQRFVDHLMDRFLQIEIALGIVGGIASLVIFASFVWFDGLRLGDLLAYRVVLYVFAMAIGAFIGCEIPLLIRINSQYIGQLRTNLSAILCTDYVGSLIGALLFAYYLITRFDLYQIGLICGCVNVTLALVGLVYFWPFVRRKLWIGAACCLGFAVLAFCAFQSEDWMKKLEQQYFDDLVVSSVISPYQYLVLTHQEPTTENAPEEGVTNLYIDCFLQFSSIDEERYHEPLVHVPLALAEKREKILILGGGDGLALRELLRYPDVQEITLVDIDPRMIELAANHEKLLALNQGSFHQAQAAFSFEQQPFEITVPESYRSSGKHRPKVRVYFMDADLFIREIRDVYDVILIDFPDPRSLELAKLYSVNFFRVVSKRLAKHGFLSMQSTSPVLAAPVFRCIGLTMETAGLQQLPYSVYIPSFNTIPGQGHWGWYLAWNSEESQERVLQKLSNLSHLDVTTRFLTPQRIEEAFVLPEEIPEVTEKIQANTKLRPNILQYYARQFR